MKNKILGKKFIVTGSSGWIGRCLIERLYSNFGHKLNDNIIALSHSSKSITLSDGYRVELCGYDHNFKSRDDYILCHFAFLTMDKLKNMEKEQYYAQNEEIRTKIFKIIQKTKPKSIIYSSSGAVYKKDNLYGQMKLDDEKYFQKIAKEVGCNIIIPRIFNIGGPYINKHNLYAISDFINQLTTTEKVVINATHPVIRSYVHIYDILELCFAWIFDENNAKKSIIFDTQGEKDVDLVELAGMIIEVLGIKGGIVTNPNYPQRDKTDKYVGNGKIFHELLNNYSIDLRGYGNIIKDTYEFLEK